MEVNDELAHWLAGEAEKLEGNGHVVAFLNWEGRGYDHDWKDDLRRCLEAVKMHKTAGPIKWGFHDVGLAVVAPAKRDRWVEVRYGNATPMPIQEEGIPRGFFDEAVKDATLDFLDWYETVSEIEKGFSCQKEMTVGELIEELKKCSPDKKVEIVKVECPKE